MYEKVFLFTLIPYTLFLIWKIRQHKFSEKSMVILCLVTLCVVWGILYSSFGLVIFPPDTASAFALVETIMRETEFDITMRYVAEKFGWILGLVYFWVCWGLTLLSTRDRR